jgi:hypothetical protein
LRRAIPANAVTSDALDTGVQVLVEERKESAGAETTTSAAGVCSAEATHDCRRRRSAVSCERRRSRDRIAERSANDAARIDAIAEKADDAEGFVVTEAGVGCNLED